jgi:hypothetical protein
MYLSLRYTFGGAAFPSLWSIYSDTITDLANDLLQCPLWNHETQCSPLQPFIPLPTPNLDNSPFAEAKPLAVSLPANDAGIADVYIDDIPPVCVDIGNNAS